MGQKIFRKRSQKLAKEKFQKWTQSKSKYFLKCLEKYSRKEKVVSIVGNTKISNKNWINNF